MATTGDVLATKYPRAHGLWANEVALINDPTLRDKVLAVWEYALDHTPLTLTDLEEIPFSLLVPNCKVSFMTHKRGVVHVAHAAGREIARRFSSSDLPLDMDVLVAGAILLDVGKLLEYTRDAATGKLGTSETGTLLRHTFSGAGLCMRFDVPIRVVHCVAYHSKEGDLGKRTVEGHVLHHVDFMTFEPMKDHLW
ncbi:HD domain protein [Pelomyxa schiedti]|nr:HD domain protein [Pelomyxa schiedti]